MNIKQIAKECGAIERGYIARYLQESGSILFENEAQLQAFAKALIGDSEQEPVAWVCGGELYLTLEKANEAKRDWSLVAKPLFTKPPSNKDAEHMMTITKSSYFAMEKQTADRRAECERYRKALLLCKQRFQDLYINLGYQSDKDCLNAIDEALKGE